MDVQTLITASGSRTTASTASRVPARRRMPLRGVRGVTLVELLLGILIVGVLVTMSIATYSSYTAKTSTGQAISDISMIQAAVSQYAVDNQGLPASLAEVGAQYAALRDPWGNPYQYLSHADVNGKGQFRKDKNIVPINSDYDLYSMGPDGQSVPPLTAKPSRDDIVRANNGRFVGVAADYDP